MGSTAKKIAAIGAVIGVIGILFLMHRSSNRAVLARYKAELRAKGEKLTFKELGILPSTNTEDIACRDALNTCSNWIFTSSGSGRVPALMETIPQLMEYIGPGKARAAWRGQLHPDTWTTGVLADWDELERRNAGVGSNLAPVIVALSHPAPDTGWLRDDDFTNVIGVRRTFVRDRTLARLLVGETVIELHRGNLEAAQKDLGALVAMSQLNRNEFTLVHQMIRIAIGQVALNASWEALQAPGWDESRLASLQAEWERVDFAEALERGLIGERADTQVFMMYVRQANSREVKRAFSFSNGGKATNSVQATVAEYFKSLPWLWYRISGAANEDELFQLKVFEEGLTLARDVRTNRPWPEVAPGATNIIKEIDGAIGKDRFHRLQVTAIAIPNFTSAFRSAAHAEMLRRLAIVAIAIKRYELKHGKAPPNLNSLTPEFLSAVPIDPMSGKALCYRLNADGTHVLYSVGEDGKDDGGDARPSSQSGTPDLWSGRDAVWPTAASEEEVAKAEAVALQKTNKAK